MLHANALILSINTTPEQTTCDVVIADGPEQGEHWTLLGRPGCVGDTIPVKLLPDDQFCYFDSDAVVAVRCRMFALGFEFVELEDGRSAYLRSEDDGSEDVIVISDEDDRPTNRAPQSFADWVHVGSYAQKGSYVSGGIEPDDLWLGRLSDYLSGLVNRG